MTLASPLLRRSPWCSRLIVAAASISIWLPRFTSCGAEKRRIICLLVLIPAFFLVRFGCFGVFWGFFGVFCSFLEPESRSRVWVLDLELGLWRGFWGWLELPVEFREFFLRPSSELEFTFSCCDECSCRSCVLGMYLGWSAFCFASCMWKVCGF